VLSKNLREIHDSAVDQANFYAKVAFPSDLIAERSYRMPPVTAVAAPADTPVESGPAEPKDIPKKVVGIIYPPPEIRNIVDKTASFVARNGALSVCSSHFQSIYRFDSRR